MIPKKSSYKVNVNQQFSFEGLNAKDLDVIALGNNHFHLLHENQSFQAELLHVDYSAKRFTFKINGSKYEVQVEDQYDELIDKLGFTLSGTTKVTDVKAPMPGLVLEINVSVGQEVKEGEAILILEAMKMENVIKAAGDGIVKAIHVSKGTAVEKGFVLVEMD